MPDWTINLGLLLFAAFVVFNGLLMLVAPLLHRKFLSRMMYADSWSKSTPSAAGRSREIERRIAGLILAAIGVYFAWAAIGGLKTHNTVSPGAKSLSSVANISVQWLSWTVAFTSLALGTYISLKPDIIVNWSIRHQPIPREIPDATRHTWAIGKRRPDSDKPT